VVTRNLYVIRFSVSVQLVYSGKMSSPPVCYLTD